MPTVPSKEYSAQLPNVRVTPRNIGAEQGAQARMGEAVANLGNTLANHADELRHRDKLKYSTIFMQANSDHWTKAQQRAGEDGINVLGEYDENNVDRKEKALSVIADDNLREQVGMEYDRQSSVLRGKLAAHSIKQKGAYGVQVEKAHYDASLGAARGVTDVRFLDEKIGEQFEAHMGNNPNRSEEYYTNHLTKVRDSMYLSHLGKMAADEPALAVNYYEQNKEHIVGSLTNEGVVKAERMYKTAQRDATAKAKKLEGAELSKFFADIDRSTKAANSFSAVEKVQNQLDIAFADGEGFSVTKWRAPNNALARIRVKLEEDERLRDIFYGEQAEASMTDRTKAANLVYRESVAKLPGAENEEARMNAGMQIIKQAGILPAAIRIDLEQAARVGSAEDVRPQIVMYSEIQRDGGGVVDGMKSMKDRAFWRMMNEKRRITYGRGVSNEQLEKDIKAARTLVYTGDPVLLSERRKAYEKSSEIEITRKNNKLFVDKAFSAAYKEDREWGMMDAIKHKVGTAMGVRTTPEPVDALYADFNILVKQGYLLTGDMEKSRLDAWESLKSHAEENYISSEVRSPGKKAEQ